MYDRESPPRTAIFVVVVGFDFFLTMLTVLSRGPLFQSFIISFCIMVNRPFGYVLFHRGRGRRRRGRLRVLASQYQAEEAEEQNSSFTATNLLHVLQETQATPENQCSNTTPEVTASALTIIARSTPQILQRHGLLCTQLLF